MRKMRKDLKRMLGKPRGKGRLPPAPTRDAIEAATSVGYPPGSSPGGNDCFGTLTDSSGFFILYVAEDP